MGTGNEPEEDGEPDKMKIAFARIGRFKRFIKDLLNPKNIIKRLQRKKVGDVKPIANGNGTLNNGHHIEATKNGFMDANTKLENGILGKEDMLNDFQKQIGKDMDLSIPYSETNDKGEENYDYDDHEEQYNEEIYYYPSDEVIVEECCPAVIYRKMPCCAGESAPFWQVWSRHRLLALKLIENKYFEGIVLILILISRLGY